jgi:hypothetical protein
LLNLKNKKMGKGQTKGRYICKVGFYDIYAKDQMKSGRESHQVKSTEYLIYHSKKLTDKGFKTKDLAVAKATEMMEYHLIWK